MGNCSVYDDAEMFSRCIAEGCSFPDYVLLIRFARVLYGTRSVCRLMQTILFFRCRDDMSR